MYEQHKHDLRVRIARALGFTYTDMVQFLTVGAFRRRTRRVSKKRIARLRVHLADIADRVSSRPTSEAQWTAQYQEWDDPPASAICAACKGLCCERGGDHGYLNEAALSGRMAASGASSIAEVVEAYAAHVPARTYVGSCIFHSPQGCGLPADMRSETCRVYACAALQHFRSAHPGEQQAFAMVRKHAASIERVIVFQHGDRHEQPSVRIHRTLR